MRNDNSNFMSSNLGKFKVGDLVVNIMGNAKCVMRLHSFTSNPNFAICQDAEDETKIWGVFAVEALEHFATYALHQILDEHSEPEPEFAEEETEEDLEGQGRLVGCKCILPWEEDNKIFVVTEHYEWTGCVIVEAYDGDIRTVRESSVDWIPTVGGGEEKKETEDNFLDIWDEVLAEEETPAYPDDDPKAIVGNTKPSILSIPPVAIFEMGRAMDDGRRKYGHMNWRTRQVRLSTYLEGMTRHLFAIIDGEDFASDSKLLHLAHLMSGCAIVLDARHRGALIDDRPTHGTLPEWIEENTKQDSGRQ